MDSTNDINNSNIITHSPICQHYSNDTTIQHNIHYTVRSPWEWVIRESLKKYESSYTIVQVPTPRHLPSYKSSTSTCRLSAKNKRRAPKSCTLRIEITSSSSNNPHSIIIQHGLSSSISAAAHGISTAMSSLSDKDSFARTISSIHPSPPFPISPASILLPHNATIEECTAALEEQQQLSTDIVILKTPLGSRGEGIHFFDRRKKKKDAAPMMIHDMIQSHWKRAREERGFVDFLRMTKGRIPSWVLQDEITSFLIRDGRKFHLRSYVLVTERDDDEDDYRKVYVYHRTEVRVAEGRYEPSNRDNRAAHITNGAGSDHTERRLLSDIPELVDRGVPEKLEIFLNKVLGDYLRPVLMARDVVVTNHDNDDDDSKNNHQDYTRFSLAGVDIMMDDMDRFFILEVNVNPAAPPKHVVKDEAFRNHLVGFMADLVDLVLWGKSNDFYQVEIHHSSHKYEKTTT